MKYLIAIFNLILVAYLFYRAAGSLNVTKLNVISYVFYSLLIFDFLGISIIYCGFQNHYIINKVISTPGIVDKGYWAMVWAMIMLPTTILLVNKYVYKIANIRKRNDDNIRTDIKLENEKKQKIIFKVCIVLLAICFVSIIYVFCNIGYIPLFKMFDKSFAFDVERINNGRNFVGNEYIRNLVMLLLTPMVSYLSYIYMRKTHDKKWRYLFICSFILCLFVKTYDFSKGPLIYYIAYFFFLEIMMGNIKNPKKTIKYVAAILVLVVGMYLTIGKYDGNFLSLSNGPVSRTVITQPGALLLHFDAFPEKTPYLYGRSFPKIASILLGDGENGVRSGRKVMEIYNPKAVKNGTAGVMSTVFIGEAYANFGWVGIFIAPLLVGFIISSAMCIYLKSKKTTLNMCLYLEAVITIATVVQAGFIDFIYNVSFVFIVIYFLIINYASDRNYFKKWKEVLFKKEKNVPIQKKRMIFHIPNYIDLNRKSGSNIRPFKMIEAFQKIGYDVDVVMGYGSERQQAIDEIENNILNGIKYDFLYSESSTMPTLLTEKHHLPTHPFLDFKFFKFCKKHEIKIGLFYRDIHWKFDLYKNGVSKFKAFFAIAFYKYDLKRYNSLVNIIYLPSVSTKKYVINDLKCHFKYLPPGCENKKISHNKIKTNDKNLNIFYVGGLSKEIYDIRLLFKVVSKMPNILLTVCCREKEWNANKEDYMKYMSSNIKIVHSSGNELDEYYREADLCCLYLNPTKYMRISMPIKLFEYISYKKPIIATINNESGRFVEKNDIGFVIKYNGVKLKSLLSKILKNQSLLQNKVDNINKIFKDNTWESRAKQVKCDLINNSK